MGCNPCVEQTLESFEVCNLVEIFPHHVEEIIQFKEVIKYAYLYGKSVTLTTTHIEETNRVQHKNRRIGLSQSGMAMFRESRGVQEMIDWMLQGYETVQYYDDVYAKWLGVPKSIKTTTVKPSGTVSLVAGVTAGIHYPINKHYIKRVSLANHSKLLQWAKDCGYPVEPL